MAKNDKKVKINLFFIYFHDQTFLVCQKNQKQNGKNSLKLLSVSYQFIINYFAPQVRMESRIENQSNRNQHFHRNATNMDFAQKMYQWQDIQNFYYTKKQIFCEDVFGLSTEKPEDLANMAEFGDGDIFGLGFIDGYVKNEMQQQSEIQKYQVLSAISISSYEINNQQSASIQNGQAQWHKMFQDLPDSVKRIQERMTEY